jgi:hypothetical protein
MQVINPMGEEKFDVVCETGVKLVEQLKKLLETSGLGPQEAANVLAMATGGVIKGLGVDPEQFMQAAFVSYQMWRKEDGAPGLNGTIFDPPHKRPGFIPVSRDASTEN